MVQINDDYIVQIDSLNYTVMRDAHRTTTRKDSKTGEVSEVEVFITIGYYSDLEGAIKGVIKDMNARALQDGTHTLIEAFEIVIKNNNKFSELLEKALKI